MEKHPTLVFITGGVRSGKSSFAEKLATQLVTESNGRLHYIATGSVTDHEMQERVNIHQQQRNDSNFSWITWEHERNIHLLSHHFDSKDVVLLDCVTTLLTNEWFLKGENWEKLSFQKEVVTKIEDSICMIARECRALIVVSNEVGYEYHADELIRTYMKLLANIHKRIVAEASHAYLVEASIPLLKKGRPLIMGECNE